MKIFLKISLTFLLLTFFLYAEREKINASLVISGGVSLGAYEAGYNWALIRMFSALKAKSRLIDPNLDSVTGASAGSINALLSAMYWCQKESVPLRNHVDDNLYYETWVNLGIEDLVIKGNHSENKSTLFTQDGLKKKGDKIISHLKEPIFEKGCEVPLGIAVTKAVPIVENVSGIDVKNQNFSVPLTFREKNGQGIIENKILPKSKGFYISIPGIEKDRRKMINLLLASSAFPAAFQQVKLEYVYKGKKSTHYFVDGGLYDNVPLDLAIALNPETSTFFFMDPNKMRKGDAVDTEEDEDELPVGFITPNLVPVFSSFDIMQSMKLYKAIYDNFSESSEKKLILSSRYHPITGEYLAHFGAFLDHNFRVYDYYVGVYNAIYHLAEGFKRNFPAVFEGKSQVEIMNFLKTKLGIDENPEALAAYTLLLNTEFYGIKPKTTDRFSAIYNAFNLDKRDAKRYDLDEFKAFLSKLDMRYMENSDSSFIAYAKEDIDHWYKRPLRDIIDRIAMLEKDREEAGKPGAYAVETSLVGWGTSAYLKEKKGFEFLPLNVPQDEGKEGLRTALRLLPGEVAVDVKNGGISYAYTALYYPKDQDIISGFEGKATYVQSNNASDILRADLNVFKEYKDLWKLGVGASFFGNIQGRFYENEGAYGFNAYVDMLDVLRMTYVRRESDFRTNNYIYFGVENIPSLIYWLNR